jgi:hypothetical protein
VACGKGFHTLYQFAQILGVIELTLRLRFSPIEWVDVAVMKARQNEFAL